MLNTASPEAGASDCKTRYPLFFADITDFYLALVRDLKEKGC